MTQRASAAPHPSLGAFSGVLRAGLRFGRFELLEEVGRGGMGVVWKARMHAGLGLAKTVALKTIVPGRADDVAMRRMFIDEARLLAAIEHPNVARLIDVGEEDDRY